ncbi:MAG: PTS lactose/cellobiose transporter subunit IIA [Tetragenococcus koreensis]|nr:PTS lactose/cellobiose transporter subunit IIA [Staphylococcus equorum]MDN6162146.1 PTS lactose/cellobiose transporter subunit IIA [Atopostipes sp.]MDN6732741.1 PTS lactose/cellobiose transporter subunit IIA [Tetragenococcus koreensis]MDN6572334.1 PTS lactose/cellobiose transporter subunit IIA [Staphylococcus equorum]MDN6736231.1 PTS lactose/cellobiose transporter subunit IIA [Tetragenococcus koreensis]
MTSKETISNVGFALVAYAGDAKADLFDALKQARQGNFEQARELVAEANENINEAHNQQTSLLTQEAGGAELDVTFIMVHGQDTLMTTMMLKDEINYMIDQYERIVKLEEKVERGGL